jgi:hypothetical protein
LDPENEWKTAEALHSSNPLLKAVAKGGSSKWWILVLIYWVVLDWRSAIYVVKLKSVTVTVSELSLIIG